MGSRIDRDGGGQTITTIAYRDGILVADTGLWDRGCYCGSVVKIARAKNGSLGGVAGCLGDNAMFTAWLLAGARRPGPDFRSEDSEGILINPDGAAHWVGHKKRFFELNLSTFGYALGSGFRIAMGALAHGATAEEAVRIAAQLDENTREPLTILRLKEVHPRRKSAKGR